MKLISWGTDPNNSDDLNHRLIITNKVALTTSLVSMPYFFIFFQIGQKVLAFLIIPVAIAFFLPLILNKLGSLHFLEFFFTIW